MFDSSSLLEPAGQARRLASLRAAPAFGDAFTYGVGLMACDGWVGHSGDIPGYRASVYHHAEIDTSLVVLTGSDIASGQCSGPTAPVSIPADGPCLTASNQIFGAVTERLGRPATMAATATHQR